MTNELSTKFFAGVGQDELFKVEGDFLLLLVLVDWFSYYTQEGVDNVYPVICFKEGPTMRAYWSLDKYRGISKMMLRRYLDGTLDLKQWYDTYHTLKHQIDDFYHAYYTKQHTEETLLADFVQAHALLRELCLQALFLDAFDQRAVHEVLAERGQDRELSEVWRISQILDSYSFHTKNKEDILAWYNKSPESLQYVYSNYVHIVSPEETKKTVELLDTAALTRDLEHSKREANEQAEIKKAETAKLDTRDQQLLEFVNLCNFLRDDRKASITKCDVLLYNLTSRLYELWGIPQELVGVSLPGEVAQGRAYIEQSLPVLKQRLSATSLYITRESTYEESTTESVGMVEEIYQKQHAPKEVGVVKGEAASKGVAQGKVRVVISKNEFSTFKEGEILVAAMTRPEFVPLMKMAGAIVTDEGGITCHAAIVSRELRKPCVIGTRVATKVLKDGDLVEVDGAKGTVTILN